MRRTPKSDPTPETPHEGAVAADTPMSASPGESEVAEGASAGRPDSVAPETRIAEMETRIAELAAQVETEHNLYLRTLADFQNYRRRSEEQRIEDRQFANRELIIQLLPVLDNFERAMSAAETSKSYEALVGGVALTLRQLLDFLAKNGVEAIEAVGTEFDPNFHEAVVRVEDGEHPDNTVVDELQKGYRIGSRVLRPSMVKVARSE